MSALLFAVAALCSCLSAAATSTTAVSAAGNGLSISLNNATGAFSLRVDGVEWLPGGASPPVPGLRVSGASGASGSDTRGDYTSTTLSWAATAGGAAVVLETEYRAYAGADVLFFVQRWRIGYTPPPPSPPPPPPPPSEICAQIVPHTDQTGGSMMSKLPWTSDKACCDACVANTSCDAWVSGPDPSGKLFCFLIRGHKGTTPRADRTLGIVRGAQPGSDASFIGAFPTLSTNGSVPLGYLGWGGCQVHTPSSGAWAAGGGARFDGVTSGEPLVLHEYAPRNVGGGSVGAPPRAVAVAPFGNFFVSGQAIVGDELQCGIRATVTSLPAGFEHTTAVVGGRGVNGTLVALGDLLLANGGKQRTDPYEDFVLSHLGYWTDNGAFYYHINPNFTSAEAALKAVKADLANRNIPSRYVQWDDWWMESEGDVPGMLSWTPIPSKFPSGFTDWLGLPLSLYAPEYSANNVWMHAYEGWRVNPTSGKSAIPLDPKFYLDLFRNGTTIGMKMFEQDFLCTMNEETGLTNRDVKSGAVWMAGMNAAAAATNTSLQWCMMNPCHALASTAVPRMTNGRATTDNTRSGGAPAIESMGVNSMLYYALGFFASRDNVWTTPADVVQRACQRPLCFEPSRHADNAVALLAGGPYGPSDAVGMTDRGIVMHACRDDGVLLRPSWPLVQLDVTYTTPPSSVPPGKAGAGAADPSAAGALLWAAHDDHAGGALRWSYALSVNSPDAVAVSMADLRNNGEAGAGAVGLAAWQVTVGGAVTSVVRLGASDTYTMPASPPLAKGPNVSHVAFAPVLPCASTSGLSVLGDVGRWATMSFRRFDRVTFGGGGGGGGGACSGFAARVRGTPGEAVTVSYAPAGSSSVETVTCRFPPSTGSDAAVTAAVAGCSPPDAHGDVDCDLQLTCSSTRCTCA